MRQMDRDRNIPVAAAVVVVAVVAKLHHRTLFVVPHLPISHTHSQWRQSSYAPPPYPDPRIDDRDGASMLAYGSSI